MPPADPTFQARVWGTDAVPWAVLAVVEGGVLVVEPNGFAATQAAVLGPASQGGLAIAVCWNVNMLTDVEIAEAGVVVGGIGDTQPHGAERFAELVAPIGIPDDGLSPLGISSRWRLPAGH